MATKMKAVKLKPVSRECHPYFREVVQEELQARAWSDPALVISELAKTSKHNAEMMLTFNHRFTRIQCWMLDQAFGVSAGFFSRLQEIFEAKYPGER